MLGDIQPTNSFGYVVIDDKVDKEIQGVLSCFFINLPLFVIKQKGKIDMNEDGLTQRLCMFLTRNKGEFPFHFQKEFMENDENGSSKRVDVGVYAQNETIIVNDRQFEENESFFKIEAKRLGKLGKVREKEYVEGRFEKEKYKDTGGIERFKKGIHGKKAIHSAIIGYVQLYDSNHWFATINGWISDLSKEKPEFWSENELLKNESSSPELATFTSYHLREQKGVKDEIKLHHFWIDLQ
jgi:hypothetical protein